MAAEPICRACGAPLDAVDKFCGYCGTKVDRPSSGPLMPTISAPVEPIVAEAAPSRPQPQYIAQRAGPPQPGHRPSPPQSSAFAIVTLVCYIIFPLGALLNIIGLATGPRRGCFVAMLFLILLPVVLVLTTLTILLFSGAFGDVKELMDRVRLERLLEPHDAPPLDDGFGWEPPKS